MRKINKTEYQGQVGNQTLFWVVFGVLAVGLVLLLSGGVYSPQVQPQAQQSFYPPSPIQTFTYPIDEGTFFETPITLPVPGSQYGDGCTEFGGAIDPATGGCKTKLGAPLAVPGLGSGGGLGELIDCGI